MDGINVELPAFRNSVVYCGDSSAYAAPHLKTSIIERVYLDHDTVLYSSIACKPGAFADTKITSRPSQRPDTEGAVLDHKCDAIAALQNRIVGADSKLK